MKSIPIEPLKLNRPSKHFRLVLWRLLYHVPVQKQLARNNEIDACRHARFPMETWDAEKARCQHEWNRLLAKRQRRWEWFMEHGSIPDGWTPSDPADPRRTANRPIGAYLARRRTTEAKLYAQIRFRKRRQPNWTAIQRVAAWTEEKQA